MSKRLGTGVECSMEMELREADGDFGVEGMAKGAEEALAGVVGRTEGGRASREGEEGWRGSDGGGGASAQSSEKSTISTNSIDLIYAKTEI